MDNINQSLGDFPANPLERSGYTMVFNDEFEEQILDTNKWIPYYLPHWSSREQSKANYYFENKKLVLQ
ncbi:MAG: glycosyl hydrolase, partial [Candidatus Thorarchaeota archaeon]